MKAFWWFKENSIAGMARPGFNCSRWFQYNFDEAVAVGWVGQFTSGARSIASFQEHLRTYAPKIAPYHKVHGEAFAREIKIFETREGISDVFNRVRQKTKILGSFEVTDDQIRFELSRDRLQWEIQFLKEQGIETLVTLTEEHHSREELSGNFDIHHISIKDLAPPEHSQVVQLADLLKHSKTKRKKVAVHCLAGIGRTSTMLMAAHITLGENAKDLEVLLAKQNPAFQLTGSQADFIRRLSSQSAGD
jgi:protein-tyrosine phosphatase